MCSCSPLCHVTITGRVSLMSKLGATTKPLGVKKPYPRSPFDSTLTGWTAISVFCCGISPKSVAFNSRCRISLSRSTSNSQRASLSSSAFRRVSLANASGRSCRDGIAAPCTSTGITRIFRFNAAVISRWESWRNPNYTG